jgi:hypothetical protein
MINTSTVPTNEEGLIEILNTGEGDVELKFNKENEIEMTKARAAISDMLHRGYALFVREGENLRRIKCFDPEEDCYILGDQIPDHDPFKKDPSPSPSPSPSPATETVLPKISSKAKKGKAKASITKSKVIAVGRTSGG